MKNQHYGLKHCSRCNRFLPTTEFYKNKNKKDGLQAYCKSCSNDITNNKAMLIRKLVKILEPYKTK